MLINSLVDIENWLSQDYPNSQVSVSIEYCLDLFYKSYQKNNQ